MQHEHYVFKDTDGYDGNDPERNWPPGASREKHKCTHPGFNPSVDGTNCRWCKARVAGFPLS